jgi:hypothetical protein
MIQRLSSGRPALVSVKGELRVVSALGLHHKRVISQGFQKTGHG